MKTKPFYNDVMRSHKHTKAELFLAFQDWQINVIERNKVTKAKDHAHSNIQTYFLLPSHPAPQNTRPQLPIDVLTVTIVV